MTVVAEERATRAQRLHRESFVFDYFPRGEPMVLSPSEEAAMTQALADGIPAGGVLNVIREQRTHDIATDPAAAQRMRDLWKQAGVNAVTCTLGGLDGRVDDHEAVVRDVARWQTRFRAGDYLAHCLSADDFERAFQMGKVGVFFNLQNATYIGSDVDNLDVLHGLGVRMIQLTYNTRNLLGDGCTERTQAGLSHFGVAAVKRMNALGIVVDVAHSGVQTSLDAVEVSERPIAYSHTGCRALYDHPRSKSDDQLRALAARDGYVGIYAVPFFLTDRPDASVDAMVDHVVHAAEIVGVERVGIGTDWGSWTRDVPEPLRDGIVAAFQRRGFRPEHRIGSGMALGDLDTYARWSLITEGLVDRGFSDDDVRGILGGNFLRFLRRAIG